MTAPTFDQKLQEMQSAQLRSADELTRANAGVVAIIDVAVLIRDLVTFMPSFATESERRAYLEAVQDIRIQVNAAQLQHHRVTGELSRGGRHLALPEDLVNAAYLQRETARA